MKTVTSLYFGLSKPGHRVCLQEFQVPLEAVNENPAAA